LNKKEGAAKVHPALSKEHADFLHKYYANASKEELLEAFIAHLQKEHALSNEEVDHLLTEAKQHQETLLPVNIFQTEALSSLEAIVKYLKENKHLSFHEIAVLLARDDRTIWTTYSKSRTKMIAPFHLLPSKHVVPAVLFAERRLSVLETLAHYLKDTLHLSLHDIATLLNRDDRTIWTVCSRAQKKLAKGGAP
jgi:myosin-crossreactive antigen